MTREEAIKWLKDHHSIDLNTQDDEAHRMAIEALEQKPCEDCVMGWDSYSYEGECEDCGCCFNYEFDVPIWKCALPRWIKKIIKKIRGWE